MSVLKVFLLGFIFGFSGANAQPLGTNGSVIDDARWNKRLLLICGKENAALGSPLQKAQFGRVDWHGYLQRDLTIVGVSTGTSIIFETASFLGDELSPSVHVWNDGDAKLERAASCADGKPSLTLIGKDGSMKARWDEAVSSDDLFAIIDAMPMRQSEIRRQTDE